MGSSDLEIQYLSPLPGADAVEYIAQAINPDATVLHGWTHCVWAMLQQQIGPGDEFLFLPPIPQECFSSKQELFEIAFKIFRFYRDQPAVSSRIGDDQFRLLLQAEIYRLNGAGKWSNNRQDIIILDDMGAALSLSVKAPGLVKGQVSHW